VAVDAARGESRDISSRAGDHARAANGRAADPHGFDALLSGTSEGRKRVEGAEEFNSSIAKLLLGFGRRGAAMLRPYKV